MPGLANSRHAPTWRRQRSSSVGNSSNTTTTTNPAPTSTVTPAPTRHNHGCPAPAPAPAAPPNVVNGSSNGSSNSSSSRHPPTAASHELVRYTKIVRRLRWKLPFLAAGYRQAVDRVGRDPAGVAEAELMFKLDFFEYYMLIERALVHLLGVFGIDVPRGYCSPSEGSNINSSDNNNNKNINNSNDNGGARRESRGLAASIWGDGGPRPRSRPRHRYHANVLAALDREDNPLHAALGTGEVRRQLGRAKDLRNRWKTAGDDDDDDDDDNNQDRHRGGAREPSPSVRERNWHTKKIAAPLESYNLEKMLEAIFAGLEEAFKIAERFVRGASSEAGRGAEADIMDWAAVGNDEDQWEFIVDAMDWEAV